MIVKDKYYTSRFHGLIISPAQLAIQLAIISRRRFGWLLLNLELLKSCAPLCWSRQWQYPSLGNVAAFVISRTSGKG
ncbi:uncharacterized protein IAS62_006567 [Cryptococcus decagattii]|uniref:Uncharacterized protein n=1 Tax=Cryptococcus decagattii TaxID=1859122 RepID=A0ABZ2B2X8_9TREE